VHLQTHRAEHPEHRRTHVPGHDGFDVVVDEEPCDARVVRALGRAVMQLAPADLVLRPLHDLPAGHPGQRHALGTPPPGIDLPVLGHRNRDDHCPLLLVVRAAHRARPRPTIVTRDVQRTVSSAYIPAA
jgi:hypothetical protein